MNKKAKELERLQKQVGDLKNEIYAIEQEEIRENQLPRIKKMVGWCLHSIYEERYYSKIIDLVNDHDGDPVFIMETIHLTKEGNPYTHLDNIYPYLNKEWWDKEVPMVGWERCTEAEYQEFKATIASEMLTAKMLRKFIKKKR